MKKTYALLAIMTLFISCSKENENSKEFTTKNVANSINMESYQKLAEAIDNIDVKSKASVEEQMASYLDEKYDKNFKAEFAKVKNNQKSSLTQKGNSTDDVIDLNKELNDAGFTEIQK